MRDLFAGLFEFQQRCDCSFTHGRMLPILVEHRFAYRLPLTSHPRYKKKKKAFDSAPKDRVSVDGVSKLEAATIVRDVGQRMKVSDVEIAYNHRPPPEDWLDAERWFWEP